jgi:VanZ family protein
LSRAHWLRLLAALGYLGGTFYFGTIPGGAPLGIPSDKLLHTFVFFGMVVITFPAIAWATGRWPKHSVRAPGYAFSYSVAMGALLELVQTTLPTRHGDTKDLLADVLGAGGAYLLLRGAAAWQHKPAR